MTGVQTCALPILSSFVVISPVDMPSTAAPSTKGPAMVMKLTISNIIRAIIFKRTAVLPYGTAQQVQRAVRHRLHHVQNRGQEGR